MNNETTYDNQWEAASFKKPPRRRAGKPVLLFGLVLVLLALIVGAMMNHHGVTFTINGDHVSGAEAVGAGILGLFCGLIALVLGLCVASP